ncbi:MAG: gliding motility-associated C-terminal domain-containing protein [Bacteroidetes bacterium]|nr:gliding motility-associated C-terminal domain-containing protein [Bacteroidota bacterium]
MKKFTLIQLLIAGLFLLFSNTTRASHAVGADLTYTYVGPNQYEVTLKFYRDCHGIAADNQVTINFTSATCGLTGTETLYPIAGTGNEIPTGTYNPCYVTSCNIDPATGQAGTGYGIQEHIFRGIITLPAACSDWVFSYTTCCRNAAITTVSNPGGPSIVVESMLDNLNNPIDSSPVFSTYPVSRFCVGHTFQYNQGAIDPEGDSLVFSLVDAMDAGGAPVPYIAPYNGQNPVSSVPPVSINPQTGVITFTPNVVQVGVMAVLVQEYRNGVLIGTIRRDMQVNIEAVCNFPPELSPSNINGVASGTNINANCNDSVLFVHLLVPVRCNTVASDGSDFRLLSPSGLPIPITAEIPLNCSAGLTDSIEIHLYPPNLSENGYYHLWSKVGTDGNTLLGDCGTAMMEYDTTTFLFNNCYTGIIDLQNVTVNSPNNKIEVLWSMPPGLPVSQFQSYDVYRSDFPGGPYGYIGSSLSATDTLYTDTTAIVPLQPYDYTAKIHLTNGYTSPISDSIQSIYLKGTISGDSETIALSWSPYWGWANPMYEVLESDDFGATFFPVAGSSTSATNTSYVKPSTTGNYYVRIRTTGPSGLVSLSNWYEFNVLKFDIIIPTVFTPNGDNLNETFSIKHLESYPNSKLMIFNRWGRKVYENNNYQNDWKGDDLKEGVYYYTLKLSDKKATVFNGTISIIRNK